MRPSLRLIRPGAQPVPLANPNIVEAKVRTLAGMPCKNPVFAVLHPETGRFFLGPANLPRGTELYRSIDP
jgi:hypothetical protein